jgi:hypothetical protein
MADLIEERTDYFTARATCEVTFPVDRRTALTEAVGPTINIAFMQAARGCATAQSVFDSKRQRNASSLNSVLTFFHADDERPSWVRAVQSLAGDATPPELPRPVRAIAARILSRYGPGSLTVTNDPDRPISGELIAGESGEDGEFFPADSFFDQFLLARMGGRTFTHREPLRVSAKVRAWPPAGEHYKSERATEFYDVADPEGPPAFRFGNCNIDIAQPLPQQQLAAIQEVIDVIHGG